ncbi:MAG TPA: hypothetical protein VHU44_08595 [Acidobacteriaceae bacterium]|jgi:hypothetical protein|nr:hypothetical protein [Acidobacteriaceae bacterium]
MLSIPSRALSPSFLSGVHFPNQVSPLATAKSNKSSASPYAAIGAGTVVAGDLRAGFQGPLRRETTTETRYEITAAVIRTLLSGFDSSTEAQGDFK